MVRVILCIDGILNPLPVFSRFLHKAKSYGVELQ